MDSSYRYTSKFETSARIVSPSDQDRFVAKASISSLKGLLPADINPESNPDLLYIACDGAVSGMINRNGDGITAETALAINHTAKHKFISSEHKRDEIFGFILDTGFSRFGTSEPLSKDEAAALTEPFNMCVVGALWKVVNPMLSKYLTMNADAVGSEALSLSWEIGFVDYHIAVGSKNLFDAKIIAREDPAFASYDKLLVSNGGNGRSPAGTPVFRVITGNPVILGYSIVGNPAAEVKGILPITKSAEVVIVEDCIAPVAASAEPAKATVEIVESSLVEVQPEPLLAAASENISQKSQEKNITAVNTRVTPNRPNPMDIKTISDIEQNWAEICKMEATASVALIQEAIKKGSEEYVAKIEAEKNLVKISEEAKASAEKRAAELEVSIAEVRKQLEELTQRALASELAAKYQERMASFEEEFELDDEDRQIIASDIRELSDEAFSAYAKKCKKLMAGKAKKFVPFTKKGEEDKEGMKHEKEEKEKEGCASADIKAAIASVKADGSTDDKIVNGVEVNEDLLAGLMANFAASFKLDGKPLSAPSKK